MKLNGIVVLAFGAVGLMGPVSCGEDVAEIDEALPSANAPVPASTPGAEAAPIATCEYPDAAADYSYPDGPYGILEGDRVADLALRDCDGQRMSLGQLMGSPGTRLLLLNISAGWCQTCIEETATLEEQVFGAYCQAGLKVVQILFQDERSAPATGLFCRQWRDAFGLTFPVLIDPLFETSAFFSAPGSQTPVNILVDADTGEIVFREVGSAAADLPERIGAILSEP